ncbi:NXPE family member 2-like [Gastrophryne carolinensis]
MTMGAAPIDQEITGKMTRTIPQVTEIIFNKTTSAMGSKAWILHYKPTYCLGDTLVVRVQMFNYLGERKTYGGDFLLARIHSPQLQAGASGRIEDFGNGSYNIYFTLFWEGRVRVSILLMHPSEGVATLWKHRNIGYRYILYIGKFLNNGQEVQTKCGFQLDSHYSGDKCKYADATYGQSFYCVKMPGVPCEAFISLRTENSPIVYFTAAEKALFARTNIAREIPKGIQYINIVNCSGIYSKRVNGKTSVGVGRPIAAPTQDVTTKCKTGMAPPFPGGFYLKDQWFPGHCQLPSSKPLSHIQTCLAGKMIYLMGDSTLRQWILFLPSVLPDLKFFFTPGVGWHKTYMAFDVRNNIYIQWKKHGHPFVTMDFYTVKDHAYITEEIGRLAGGLNTVVVITVGHHFRPFPIQLFIRRLYNIRDAIENLFLRSPETKVVIKSENPRELNSDVERFSDFHGYVQYQALLEVFRGLNVGIIDAWDMSVAAASFYTHPTEYIIRNQINMFLSYIC